MPGTWQPLTNPPSFLASTMLLLTDAKVMCHEIDVVNGAMVPSKNWWLLTPDAYGSYVNGTWSPLSPMKNSRLYYASAVLADGRVFVAGGEESDAGGDTKKCEMYQPSTDSWTSIDPPAGWDYIGDAPCAVLPDGRMLLGSIVDTKTAIYDPISNTWTSAASKQAPDESNSAEETWTLLPDGSVLTVECSNASSNPPGKCSERYIPPPSDQWVSAGNTPAPLVQMGPYGSEIGPAVLLPDGRLFAIGATGHTALYTLPDTPHPQGLWAAGPDFPRPPGNSTGPSMEAKDAPACLLPNGNVLCAVGPHDYANDYPGPTYFFEFDGSSLAAAPAPPNAANNSPFEGRMLLIPSGQVLFSAGTSSIYVYTPSGSPNSAWKPEITSCPSHLVTFCSYSLEGLQLNGLSQAVAYGDDASAATNYPLVRITQNGTVVYCRTFDHSTMAVATGVSPESTWFTVPSKGLQDGPADLCVIANGIVSDAVSVTIRCKRFGWPYPQNFANLRIDPGDPPSMNQAHNLIRRGLEILHNLENEARARRVKVPAKPLTRRVVNRPRGQTAKSGKASSFVAAKSSLRKKVGKKNSRRERSPK
jgi:Kelch motif protein